METAEIKSVPFALFTKDKLGKRTRAGIFAVMGNRDSGGDRLMPGCFQKTFSEGRDRARHLWNHDFSAPPTATVEDLYEISAADLPDKVREYAPDATGGAVVVRTYLNTERGNEILAALDAGAIDEMSFAFDAVKRKYIEEESNGQRFQTRIIREVRHYESSDVLWGMNPATLATRSSVLLFQLKTLLTEFKTKSAHTVTLEELAEVRALLDQLQPVSTEASNADDDFQFKLAFARLQSLHAIQPSR
jgi:HK97 family phage prohead protease